jgi:glycerol uptake facilitator-like aquaporin
MQVELGDHKTLRSKEQWRAAAAEFTGTMLFVFLGCGSVIASGTPSSHCERLCTSEAEVTVLVATGQATSYPTHAKVLRA